MTSTLLLDRTTWDLAVDASGNIAVASAPYATAQDISSAVRVFQGECWYNTALGLPYLNKILGMNQSVSVFRSNVEQVAATVQGVASVKCVLSHISASRQLSGAIFFTTDGGDKQMVGFGSTTYFTLGQSALNSSDVLL